MYRRLPPLLLRSLSRRSSSVPRSIRLMEARTSLRQASLRAVPTALETAATAVKDLLDVEKTDIMVEEEEDGT